MKSGTYTQIYIHLVFAIRNRTCLLQKSHREELFRYTSGIIENKKCKSIIVNGYKDHIHILTGLNPSLSISDFVRDVKRSTSQFINNDKKWFAGKFYWQDGYGAFSYSKSQLDNVYKYILFQEQHHSKRTFRVEYMDILEKFDVDYSPQYLFEFFD